MDVDTTVLLSARSVLAVVLLAAGAAKLADLRAFETTILGLGNGMSARGARMLALVLAASEAGIGFASLAGVWPGAVDIAVLALLVVFAGVTAYAWRRNPGGRCRCFGALSESRFGPREMARSVLLAATGVAVVAAGAAGEAAYDATSLPGAALLICAVLFALACAQSARALAFAQLRRLS
jgi:hypothetical protein